MPFWRAFFHVVWSTKNRRPLITAQIEPRLFGALEVAARRLDVSVRALGGADDHVHVTLSIPPALAPAEVIRQLKGASARLVNQELSPEPRFAWESGYGLFTLGPRQLTAAVD